MIDLRDGIRIAGVVLLAVLFGAVLFDPVGIALADGGDATSDTGGLELAAEGDVNARTTTANDPDAGNATGVVDAGLQSAAGEVEVFVRLDEVDGVVGPQDRKTRVRRAQAPTVETLTETEGVEVEERFWLVNAVLVRVDTDRVELSEIAGLDPVAKLHRNVRVERRDAATTWSPSSGRASGLPSPRGLQAPPGVAPSVEDASHGDHTYGLEMIGAPEVWDQYGTQGGGIKVAVLDTGIDVDHSDLDLYRTNDSDPTYPGGWAEFDDGRVSGSEPYDSGEHGTHVSGTVSGGASSGTHVGVAPGVDLMHGKVLDNGSGYLSDVVKAMEWAVDNDADVVSMSLGQKGGGYADQLIDPVRNAESAGVVVVSSIGNSGEGTSSSPGNVYESIGVGAVDSNRDVPDFSSGETVDTDQDWSNPPSDWPAEYVVPAVAAPGVSVQSTLPNDDYGYKSGTSMAAPHVAGAVALVQAATSERHDPGSIETALRETATKPDGWSHPDDEPDTRYGRGIIDVPAAITFLQNGNDDMGVVVDVTGTNSPIQEGDTLGVSAAVENTGDTTRTRTVTLDVGGTQRDATEVTLDPGERKTLSLFWATGSGDGGGYTAEVATGDDTDTTSVTVESLDPASFAVGIDSTNSPVTEGEELTVTATVKNTGEQAGAKTVTLDVGGTQRDAVDVSLDPGERQTVTLTWTPDAGDAGEYTATAASEDDSDSTAVTVESPGPATFQVSLDSTNSPVTEGEELTVTATVENTGGQAGTKTVSLQVGNSQRDSTDVALGPGERQSVTLTWETTGGDAGEYTATVASEDDSDSTAVTVDPNEEWADLAVEINWSNSPVEAGDDLKVMATVENTGNGTGAGTLTLSTGGSDRATEELALSPGKERTVTLAWSTVVGDAGEYTATVSIGDASDTTEVAVDVNESAGVSVALRPGSTGVGLNRTRTLDIVVTNPSEGIGTYDLDLDVEDPSVARIADVRLTNDPGFPSVKIADDGSSAELSVGMGNDPHDPADAVVIARVVVRGSAEGSTTIGLSGVSVTDADVRQYQVGAASGAQLEVGTDVAPAPVVDGSSPRDLGEDGLYEDVNGDGRFGIGDVQALFANRNSDTVQDDAWAYDFAGSDSSQVGIGDVQALFSRYQNRDR